MTYREMDTDGLSDLECLLVSSAGLLIGHLGSGLVDVDGVLDVQAISWLEEIFISVL
jgi:hypothetical protein